jgi:hypothetical protein
MVSWKTLGKRWWAYNTPFLNEEIEHLSDVGTTVAPCLGSMLFAFFHEAGFLLPGPHLMFIHLVHALYINDIYLVSWLVYISLQTYDYLFLADLYCYLLLWPSWISSSVVPPVDMFCTCEITSENLSAWNLFISMEARTYQTLETVIL